MRACDHFASHRSIEKQTTCLFRSLFSFCSTRIAYEMEKIPEKSRARNRFCSVQFNVVSLSFVLIGVIIGLKTAFLLARSCWAPGQHLHTAYKCIDRIISTAGAMLRRVNDCPTHRLYCNVKNFNENCCLLNSSPYRIRSLCCLSNALF